MKLNYDFNKDKIIIQCIKDFFPESDGICIPIIFSDEVPPILIINQPNIDKHPICGLGGKYDPKTKEITIYLQGLNRATEDLGNIEIVRRYMRRYNFTKSALYQMLLKVVIVHEIGHYWFYNFADNPELMEDKDYIHNKIDYLKNDLERNNFIDEWIAQMFAYLCLTDPAEKKFMVKFSKKQPEEYRTFKENGDLNLDNDTFKQAAGLLQLKDVYRVIGQGFKTNIVQGGISLIREQLPENATLTIKGINNAASFVANLIKYSL
jgi:hypothetical protein